MKRIHISNYRPEMGVLIDVQREDKYLLHPTENSINIYADKLLMNHNNILDKNKHYYITCNKGQLSKKVVATLEYFGYDVTQVIK